jgi:DNA-binding NtrC family response regulator
MAGLAPGGSASVSERILVVDLDEPWCQAVLAILGGAGYDAECCATSSEALARLSGGGYRVLVTQAEPPGNVIEGVRHVHDACPGVSVILLGVDPTLGSVVTALESGVFDFLTRSFDPDTLSEHLLDAVRRAFEGERAATSMLAPGRHHVTRRDAVREVLVGECDAIEQARDEVRAALRTDLPVLIRGESGTEKLAVARLLHASSDRRDEPFVVVNTVQGDPAAELARAARSCTLFFADVSQLDAVWYMAVLELLNNLGQGADPTGPRIIAGLQHPPPPSWEGGVLARLLDRVGYSRVHLPPLRERGRDVVILAEHFAEQARLARGDAALRITGSAIEALLRHGWPGNVDELRFAIQHAASLCADSMIRVTDLPPGIGLSLASSTDEHGAPVHVQSLEEMELAYIMRVLEAVGGNKASAARLLGVDRTTLYRKLQRQEGSVPSELPFTRRARR